MGTDWVQLFDLDLAKQIVSLDHPRLEQFLAERGPSLAERDRASEEARVAEAARELPKFAENIFDAMGKLGLGLPEGLREAGRAQRGAGWAEQASADFLASSRQRVEAAGHRWARFAERLRDGETLDRLRIEIAWAAGRLGDDLPLDYFGCANEVFGVRDPWPTCETNRVIDPDSADGDTVAFLGPDEVDRMLASLRANWANVTIMDEAGLDRLAGYRDRCVREPGLRVAYFIDY
jgi:hypothetical protein